MTDMDKLTEELLRSLIKAIGDGMEISFTVKRPDTQNQMIPGRKAGNPAGNTVRCPKCGWHHTYSRSDNARRGWKAHLQACPGRGTSASDLSNDRSAQWLKDQMKGKE